jgi:hypothetical protein
MAIDGPGSAIGEPDRNARRKTAAAAISAAAAAFLSQHANRFCGYEGGLAVRRNPPKPVIASCSRRVTRR